MAALSPRNSNDGLVDFTLQLVKPIPDFVAKFVRDYDISKMGKMLSAPDDGSRSFKEKMEAINKNLDLFKRPHACRPPLDLAFVDFDDEDDEDDEDEDDEEDEMIRDEEKPDGDVELQVPMNQNARSQDYQKALSLRDPEKKLRLKKQATLSSRILSRDTGSNQRQQQWQQNCWL